jgi:hypothetical protein
LWCEVDLKAVAVREIRSQLGDGGTHYSLAQNSQKYDSPQVANKLMKTIDFFVVLRAFVITLNP